MNPEHSRRYSRNDPNGSWIQRARACEPPAPQVQVDDLYVGIQDVEFKQHETSNKRRHSSKSARLEASRMWSSRPGMLLPSACAASCWTSLVHGIERLVEHLLLLIVVVAVGAALAQAPRLPSGLRQVPQSRLEVQPLQDGLQDEGKGDTTMRPPGADGEHDHAIGVVMHGILDIIHN